MVHRIRQGLVEQRTSTINHIRGLLSEFDVVLPLRAETVRRDAMSRLEDLQLWANTVVGDLLSELHHLVTLTIPQDSSCPSLRTEKEVWYENRLL